MLVAVRESGGLVVGVSDTAIFEMQQRAGREEGIWIEPASAAPLAALAQLRDQGQIQAEARVVCVCSGTGFKDTHLAAEAAEAVNRQTPLPFDAAEISGKIS